MSVLVMSVLVMSVLLMSVLVVSVLVMSLFAIGVLVMSVFSYSNAFFSSGNTFRSVFFQAELDTLYFVGFDYLLES